jgi:phosphoglycolate phosphatase-like HAD superfamily hydrolase
MRSHDNDYLRIVNRDVIPRLGHIRHVLFDFDGTLSVLRQGWEDVMIPLMVESICGVHPVPPAIEGEVRDYVDRSTGILTIRQMEWLAEAVHRYHFVDAPLTAAEYKARYLDRLLVRVNDRIAQVERGVVSPEVMMIAGAVDFVSGMKRRGAMLYLASGTDHPHVLREVRVLALDGYFGGGAYGALDESEANSKERVIQRILEEHGLAGHELLVAGDGPVEIREGSLRGAITLGVASNEVAREGWNAHKARRLIAAGADLLVPDFTRSQELLMNLLPLPKSLDGH